MVAKERKKIPIDVSRVVGEKLDTSPVFGVVGQGLDLKPHDTEEGKQYKWRVYKDGEVVLTKVGPSLMYVPRTAGSYEFKMYDADATDEAEPLSAEDLTIFEKQIQEFVGKVGATLGRSVSSPTSDQPLWVAIRDRTRAIGFSHYFEFVKRVLCGKTNSNPREEDLKDMAEKLNGDAQGVAGYDLLKTATEAFLIAECGVKIDIASFSPEEESRRLGFPEDEAGIETKLREYLKDNHNQLPYLARVIRDASLEDFGKGLFCDRVLTSRAQSPCLLELIWSYWHEEGMLVQSMNAVSRRFQNMRAPGARDPLAHLEIDPLRPLNNFIWGHIQDEVHRLSVQRRAYEYDHHYGLALYGKAVRNFRPADSRSKFLEGFHNLLHVTSQFYKEDNDTTVVADGYPLLNALKEVHLLLAQGAHNQFGDLPWTARVEMLMQQWMLARSEMREFLQSRVMVPYKEAWMPQVDTMKTLQGWSDVTVTHYGDLGTYGEQILLSVRYGDWIGVNDEDSAKNWARYWRPEVQGYLHAYRAVTGVDLSNPDTVDATMPSIHLQKRLAMQGVR